MEEKKDFIENELSALVKKINKDVSKLIPKTNFKNDDIEFVTVKFENGYFKSVDIACDSLGAIARDVIKAIM